MEKEPSRLDEIRARLALLYGELGQVTDKRDVRRVAELQTEIKALLREQRLTHEADTKPGR